MDEEPKCPSCGAEVEIGQKMCAWCGADLPKTLPPSQTPPERPAQTTPTDAAGQPAPVPKPGRPNGGGSIAAGDGGSTTPAGPSVDDARNLARSGNLDGAMTAFEEILRSDSTHQEALFGIGGVHFKKGDKRKAAEAWLKLRRINPAYPHIGSWISQVQEAFPQPTPAPSPARPAPAPPPPVTPSSFSRRPSARTQPGMDLGTEPHEGDNDWTRQSVRIDVAKKTEERESVPEPVPVSSEPIPEFRPNPIPIWVTPLSWILVIGYAVLFVGVYFLTG